MIFLVIEKENRFVRFHAAQSIAVSIVLIVVSIGLSEGRGTVKIDDTGAGAIVTFDGTTKDGVALKGTIKCYSVMRNG